MEGLVIKSTGSWYEVKTDEGVVCARLRGRFKLEDKKITNPIAVGDRIELGQMNVENHEWIVEKILPRTNYIIRKSPRKKHHNHLIATNVDQAILITTLKMPHTSLGFIDRFLVTLEAFRIPGVIVFNKMDLLNESQFEKVAEAMDRYEHIGYRCLTSSFEKQGIGEDIKAMIEGKTSLISGHSGVGKSTMINLLVPGLDQKTAEVSNFANKGVHTTTFAEMFFVNDKTAIIDTPGIKELGLAEIESEELSHYFPEMREHLGHCKFHNCTHVNEPGCLITEKVKSGEIAFERYESYLSMLMDEDNRR